MSKRCKLGLILSHFINCQIPKKLTKIESTQTTRSCTMWRSWKEQEVKGKKSCFHGTKEYDLFISSLCLQFWIKDYNLKHLWKAHHSSLKAVNPPVLESTKLQKNIFSLLCCLLPLSAPWSISISEFMSVFHSFPCKAAQIWRGVQQEAGCANFAELAGVKKCAHSHTPGHRNDFKETLHSIRIKSDSFPFFKPERQLGPIKF